MSTRWWTLGVWAAVAASALYWGLKLLVVPPPLPPQTQVAELGVAARADLSRLLGVDAPKPIVNAEEPPADARFQLLGVFSPQAPKAAREGVALIAVDGKPAKAFRVGAVIDGQTVLQGVGARSARLGPRDGAASVALNIAPQAPAATGTLPSGAALDPAMQGNPTPAALPQRQSRRSSVPLQGVPARLPGPQGQAATQPQYSPAD
jgi:general secretion pathway protein C